MDLYGCRVCVRWSDSILDIERSSHKAGMLVYSDGLLETVMAFGFDLESTFNIHGDPDHLRRVDGP
jgi:hypothetical protein